MIHSDTAVAVFADHDAAEAAVKSWLLPALR